MVYTVRVETFEGPLDLLLQLIEEKKLDITQVSLAQVTDQYISAMDRSREKIPAYELADFLIIAAKLLFIKSKALLPYLIWDDEDEQEGADLEKQLKMYREYYEASKHIQRIIAQKRFCYFREKFFITEDIGFQAPHGIDVKRLAGVFQEIIEGIESPLRLQKSIVRKTVSLQEKIHQIRHRLLQEARFSFRALLRNVRDKTEMIVSFLALLELMKQREIFLHQKNLFGEIIIQRTGERVERR